MLNFKMYYEEKLISLEELEKIKNIINNYHIDFILLTNSLLYSNKKI